MVDLERHLRRNITHIRIPQRLPLLPSRKHEVDVPAAPTHHSIPLSEPCSHVPIRFPRRTSSHHCQAEQNAHETVQALRTEIGVRYSADVPMDQADVVEWCVSQLEECGKKAGMEAFNEAETNWLQVYNPSPTGCAMIPHEHVSYELPHGESRTVLIMFRCSNPSHSDCASRLRLGFLVMYNVCISIEPELPSGWLGSPPIHAQLLESPATIDAGLGVAYPRCPTVNTPHDCRRSETSVR